MAAIQGSFIEPTTLFWKLRRQRPKRESGISLVYIGRIMFQNHGHLLCCLSPDVIVGLPYLFAKTIEELASLLTEIHKNPEAMLRKITRERTNLAAERTINRHIR